MLTKKKVKEFKVNYLYAIIPIIPLVLLVLGSKQVAVIPEISVPVSMLIGTAIGIIAVRPNVTEAVKKFFRGTGDGMCDVVGLMALLHALQLVCNISALQVHSLMA